MIQKKKRSSSSLAKLRKGYSNSNPRRKKAIQKAKVAAAKEMAKNSAQKSPREAAEAAAAQAAVGLGVVLARDGKLSRREARQAAEKAAAQAAVGLGIVLAQDGKLSRREARQAAEVAAAKSLGEQPGQGNIQTRFLAANLAASEASKTIDDSKDNPEALSRAEAEESLEIEAEATAIAAAAPLGKEVIMAGIKSRREARKLAQEIAKARNAPEKQEKPEAQANKELTNEQIKREREGRIKAAIAQGMRVASLRKQIENFDPVLGSRREARILAKEIAEAKKATEQGREDPAIAAIKQLEMSQ